MMVKKCAYCGEAKANGYAVAAHLTKRLNTIYFCKEEECVRIISVLCMCVNIMNRRLKEGPLYPAKKKTKKNAASPSECQRLYARYKQLWSPQIDYEAFPHPNYFKDAGIKNM